jgi:hypothetical protein
MSEQKITPEFAAGVAEFIDENDELMRRLAAGPRGEAPAHRGSLRPTLGDPFEVPGTNDHELGTSPDPYGAPRGPQPPEAPRTTHQAPFGVPGAAGAAGRAPSVAVPPTPESGSGSGLAAAYGPVMGGRTVAEAAELAHRPLDPPVRAAAVDAVQRRSAAEWLAARLPTMITWEERAPRTLTPAEKIDRVARELPDSMVAGWVEAAGRERLARLGVDDVCADHGPHPHGGRGDVCPTCPQCVGSGR